MLQRIKKIFILMIVCLVSLVTTNVIFSNTRVRAEEPNQVLSFPPTKEVRQTRQFRVQPIKNGMGDIIDYDTSNIWTSIWYDDGRYAGYLYIRSFEIGREYYFAKYSGTVKLKNNNNYAPYRNRTNSGR